MRFALGVVVLAGCRGLLGFDEPVLATIGNDGPGPNDAIVDVPTDSPVVMPSCEVGPPGCEAFTCPGSGSCYYKCEMKRSWTSASDRCVQDGLGCLVTINSATENDCITQATAPVFPDLVWFGYSQAGSAVTPIDGWSWQCGASAFLAPNWGGPGGEPNDANGSEDGAENCGSVGSGGGWIDAPCASAFRYVCEL